MSDTSNQYRKFSRYLYGILPDCDGYKFNDKSRNISKHITYMLNRTQSMFKWEGLPDSIPQRILESYLQINGNVCFYEYDNTLYVFTGGMGGEPDVYFMPSLYTIANPYLNISKNLKIDTDCVVIPNDSFYVGLLPMFERYATSIVETELSIDIATINSRIVDLISASDDRTKESAMKFLDDIRDGKLGVIAENAFYEGLRSQPYGATGNTNTITNLIELIQYQKASWYNDLGLNANYNMKRESINSGESQLNNDALLPLVDNMLECRKIGAEKVNAMYGTNITVDLASSWEDNMKEIESEQEQLDNDGKEVEDEDGTQETE